LPKIKTHRGAAKRFKKTATGKVKASHAFHRHLLGGKPAQRKRRLGLPVIVNSADEKKVKKLLPY
jgi:large subunit ribosomal protein L35